MRQSEELPLDPETLAELEAIDAALSGEAVDPVHAELAELSLLLAAEAPKIPADSARMLDERVARRFGRPSKSGRTSFIWRPAFGAGLGAAAAAVIVVLAVHSGSGGNPGQSHPLVDLAKSVPPRVHSVAADSPQRLKSLAPTLTTASPVASPPTQSPAAVNGASSTTFGAAGSIAAPAPAPIPSGRRQVQSAQLQLVVKSTRIDAVSQELFNVVSAENGIVKSSQVTSQTTPGGYATFSLSIPTSKLQATMTRLSALPYAHVVSRTDGAVDVTNEYAGDQRKLADAQALRTSLLKQLATAFTATEIDSIKAQIQDAERTINSDSSALKGLQNQISYSSVLVQINTSPVIVPVGSASKSSGGLSLGQAAHDAGRVLTVAAGVILIGLAALVPVALLGALIAWIAYWVRRRRREHALDSA